MSGSFPKYLFSILTLLACSGVQAHPGHAETNQATGLLHSLSGNEALLIMMGVGVLVYLAGRMKRHK